MAQDVLLRKQIRACVRHRSCSLVREHTLHKFCQCHLKSARTSCLLILLLWMNSALFPNILCIEYVGRLNLPFLTELLPGPERATPRPYGSSYIVLRSWIPKLNSVTRGFPPGKGVREFSKPESKWKRPAIFCMGRRWEKPCDTCSHTFPLCRQRQGLDPHVFLHIAWGHGTELLTTEWASKGGEPRHPPASLCSRSARWCRGMEGAESDRPGHKGSLHPLCPWAGPAPTPPPEAKQSLLSAYVIPSFCPEQNMQVNLRFTTLGHVASLLFQSCYNHETCTSLDDYRRFHYPIILNKRLE